MPPKSDIPPDTTEDFPFFTTPFLVPIVAFPIGLVIGGITGGIIGAVDDDASIIIASYIGIMVGGPIASIIGLIIIRLKGHTLTSSSSTLEVIPNNDESEIPGGRLARWWLSLTRTDRWGILWTLGTLLSLAAAMTALILLGPDSRPLLDILFGLFLVIMCVGGFAVAAISGLDGESPP